METQLKDCYTLPELSKILEVPQDEVLDLIANFLADKDKDELKKYLCTTGIYTL